MTDMQRTVAFGITIAILAGLGLWQLIYVNPGLGAGLIGGVQPGSL